MKRSHLSAGVSDTTNERARMEEYDTPGHGDHVSRDDGPGNTPDICSANRYHPESGRSDICNHSLLQQQDMLPPSSYTTNRTLGPHGIQSGDIGRDQRVIHPDALKTMIAFIKALQEASLDGSTVVLSREALVRLRNPPQNLPRHSVDDNARLATDLHLGKPSEATYELNRAIFLRCYPDTDIPTYHKATRLVADITGVETQRPDSDAFHRPRTP
ncbi:hypothetical protein BC826DRAFT_1107316 [Russula brevipes]|nr:hypothetical protein BC826DRAFT_1107316 [Russula brevipes]